MNILSELRGRFRAALAELVDSPDEYLAMVRPSQDSRFGDFQANMAMPLKQKLNRNPREIAEQIIAQLDVADYCHPPELAGPGFINLTLRDDWLEQHINKILPDERLGVKPVANPKTIIIDFSAPNVAKPMHVGHLRSSVIGSALRNVLRFLGHRVIGDNHIGDWGTQFGMIIYGYKHFLDEAAYRENPVLELARLYRLVNQLSDYHAAVASQPVLEEEYAQKSQALKDAESSLPPDDKKARKQLSKQRKQLDELKSRIEQIQSKREAVESSKSLKALADAHPGIADSARQETAKLHAGDEENVSLWNQFLPECLKMLQSVYDRLGIEFEETLGESFYQPMLADVVADLETKQLARQSEGAICVFNEAFNAPFIVRKSDGAFTYATTDLATIKYRVEHFQADEILYVVDIRQSEHFEQLFATARQWGYDQTEYHHVKFGTILGPDKKPYKTRSGDTVGLESLIDEAISRAREIVNANDDAKPEPTLDEQARAEIANVVGIGAIKYADLHHNRESDYVFSWDKMLAMTGDTAPYLQYAFARVHGIFRKGEIDREKLLDARASIQFSHPSERALSLQICRFAEVLSDVVEDYRPNLLTQYLFELANRFATFYENCPVFKAESDQLRNSRLLLCDLTARVIRQGLNLLGIDVAERM
ncbi:MAG: arginine--tRNA ligase [Planctomycetaceae bacterium]